MEFKDMLKYLRTSHDMSQAELAKVIGVSASTIGMYEAGAREPDFETEEKIADYFNVSLDVLRGKSSQTSAIDIFKNKKKCNELMKILFKLSDQRLEELTKYAEFLATQEPKKEEGKT